MTYTYTGKLSTKIELYEFAVPYCTNYPVYLLVCHCPAGLNKSIDSRGVVAVLLMLQSWTPAASNFATPGMQAWTLSVEMFFTLFPTRLAICGGLQLRGITTGMILVGTAIVAFGLPTITPGTQSIPLIPNGSAYRCRATQFRVRFRPVTVQVYVHGAPNSKTLARGPITFLTSH